MDYDSSYWKKRIIEKYTTGATKERIIESFHSNNLPITQENIDKANDFLLQAPWNGCGKRLSHSQIIEKLDRYASCYSFTHDIRLITADDLI